MMAHSIFDISSQAMPVMEAMAELNNITIKPSGFIGLVRAANLGRAVEYNGPDFSLKFERLPEKQSYHLAVRHGSGPTALTIVEISPRGYATSTDSFAWAKLESAAKKMRQAIENRR